MEIIEEIRQFFASQLKGARTAKSLSTDYPGLIIRDIDGFGVAIEWDNEDIISEHFANAHLFSSKMLVSGEEKNFIILKSYREDLRNEFASVCAQFLDPGKDGEERTALLSDPLSWWSRWKNLLGNSIADRTPYSVLGELLVLEHVLQSDNSARWTATHSGTHDIEADSRSYEVKSTIKRYGAEVTISGQFQLLTPKPLELHFIRMELSPAGVSINELVERLIALGYDRAQIEYELYKQGYERGSSARDIKYSILDRRIYDVNDSFPKIVDTSFKDEKIPQGITHITYTVNLDGLTYMKY